MYTEDDMNITYDNYKHFLKSFNILWPDYMPTFIRTEANENIIYSAEIYGVSNILKDNILHKANKRFIELDASQGVMYSAAWVMPMKYIKKNIVDDFYKIPIGTGAYREIAAMYTTRQLNKKGLIEIDNNNIINPNTFIQHLYPSNLLNGHSRLPIDKLFIIT